MHKHEFIFTALAALALSFVLPPSLSAKTKAGAKHEKNSHAKMAGASLASMEKTPYGKMI